MKSLYYRPEKVSSQSLLAIALLSVLILAGVEWFPVGGDPQRQDRMLAAAERTERALKIIGQQRRKLGHRIFLEHDPAGSGLLGASMSQVTSLPGHLTAKQTSVNPNFAAVVAHHLLDVGVRPGDEVAIGCTGSFPALNLSVLAAAEALQLRPLLISSAASSQFGANDPDWMWPDMERMLFEEGLIQTRSAAISRGGLRDAGCGMTEASHRLLDEAIDRNGRPLLLAGSLRESIDRRLELYTADGEIGRFAAYINIGGGSASVGGSKGNDLWGCGLIEPADYRRLEEPIDSVAARFLAADIPLINMVDVVTLARSHGLPVAPTATPAVGEGSVYQTHFYRRPLATLGIFLVLGMTSIVIRPPVRLTTLWIRIVGRRVGTPTPQWMV